MRVLILAFLLLPGCGGCLRNPWTALPHQAGNEMTWSFDTAKKRAVEIHFDVQTLYCGCRFLGSSIDRSACGYVPERRGRDRVEWEHVVPAAVFGRTFTAWRDGDVACETNGKPYRGRRCAGKVSAVYRRIETDLYNLWPSVGELNGARSDSPYGEVAGEARRWGRCDFEVDRVVEPRESVRGEIARTYLYMDAAYPDRGIVNDHNGAMLSAWDTADPVDAMECRRAARIENVQRNINWIVRRRCENARLWP